VDEVTDATFESEVLRSDVPIVVDFWAPWCGPCRAVAPILQALSEEQDGRLRFAKLNIDDNYVTASRSGVLSIPTVILFENGEPQETVIGARPRAHCERAWARWLS